MGVKQLLDFAGKRPWLEARRQPIPALKNYLELWQTQDEGKKNDTANIYQRLPCLTVHFIFPGLLGSVSCQSYCETRVLLKPALARGGARRDA